MSPIHDQEAVAKDAFAFPWTGLRAYVYQPDTSGSGEGEQRKTKPHSHRSVVGGKTVVSSTSRVSGGSHRPVSGSSRHHTAGFRRSSSGSQQTSADRVEAIRHGLNKLQLAPQVIDAILHSRRDSTAKCTVLGGGFG